MVEIGTVVRRLSAACGRSRRLDAAPSAMSRVSLSRSVSGSVSSRLSGRWYSSLLSSLKRSVSRCACPSGFIAVSIKPLVVLLFSGGPWVALIEHCPHSAREKDSGMMAGGCVTSSSGSCPFRLVAFPIRIPRCRRRRVYVVLDCPLGVLADWSQWSWVRRCVYVRSDCRPAA